MEKRDKEQTKPAGPDVRNKHGAVVISWFRKVIEVTFGAALQHIKRPNKRPTARFKNISLVTSWTF